MIVHTEGIVLGSFDFRETSKIVTFFTLEQGKVKGVLKGIRKDPRKFGSSVEKFTVNDIVYYAYRNSEIHLVSKCDLKAFFFKVRNDYQRNLAANYVLELVNTVMPVEEKNVQVYELMRNFLQTLEMYPDIDKLIYILQIKMLLLSGFQPHLDACVKCGNRISLNNKVRFSLRSGGLVCQGCPLEETTFHLVSKGAIASVLHIERSAWAQSYKLGLTPTVRQELKFLLDHFLTFHLERQLKSAKYFNPQESGVA